MPTQSHTASPFAGLSRAAIQAHTHAHRLALREQNQPSYGDDASEHGRCLGEFADESAVNAEEGF